MNIVQGNFTLVASGDIAKCYWNGTEIVDVIRFHINYEDDEQLKINLVLRNAPDSLVQEMISAGIQAKNRMV